MKGIKKFKQVILIALLLVVFVSTPAMADRSNNNHKKEAEVQSGKTIRGKVNMTNDKVDYYKLEGHEGKELRFVLKGSDRVVVYVYDDNHKKGYFKKSKNNKGKRFKITGTCYLKVVAKQKDEDNKACGGGSYIITIKS